MDTRKAVLPLLCVALLTGPTAGLNVDKNSLSTEEVNATFTDSGFQLTNPDINETITYRNAYLPKELQGFVKKYKEKAKTKEGNLTQVEIQYKFPKNSSIPKPLQGYKYKQKTKFEKTDGNGTLDKKVKVKGGKIQATVYTHYSNFMIRYKVLNNQGKVVKTYENYYTDEEAEKILFNQNVTQIGEDKYQQSVTRDNTLGSKDYEILHIVRPEKSNLSSIDFNGAEHRKCGLSYLQYSRPRLLDAGLKESLVINSMYQRTADCYNITVPADSKVTVDMNYSYDQETRQDGRLVVQENPQFFTYIVGSGAVLRVTGSTQVCGTVGNESIVVEGTLQICDSGATLDTTDLIKVKNGGVIDGYGRNGQDETDSNCGSGGENGAPVTLKSDKVVIDGKVLTYGGVGGDADSEESDACGGGGGPGGHGANVVINSFQLLMKNGRIYTHGGDGGNADNDGQGGGAGGDSGKIDIDTTYTYITGSNNVFHIRSGDAGDRTAKDAYRPDPMYMDGYNLTLENITVKGKAGRPGYGRYYPVSGDYESSGAPAKGAIVEFKENVGRMEDSFINVEGSHGALIDSCEGAEGGDGGKWNSTYNDSELIDNEISADGGDAGDQNGQICNDNDANVPGGDGGYIGNWYKNDLVNAFNNFHAQGGQNEDSGTGADGTVETVQDSSLSGFKSGTTTFEPEYLKAYDQNKDQEGELYQRKNLLVEWGFTLSEDAVKYANITLEDPSGNTTVTSQEMTQIAKEQTANGDWQYVYQFNYSVPQRLDSGGQWFIETSIEDSYGNTWVDSREFTYQYKQRDIQEPIQGTARVGQPIRFDQDITVTNPSDNTYGKGDTEVKVKFDLIKNVVIDDTEVQKPDNSIVPYTAHRANTYITWNISKLKPGESKSFTVIWYMEEIEVRETTEVNETNGRKIASQYLEFENPTQNMSLSNVELMREFYAPKRTVDYQLLTNDGTDITQSSDYDTFFADDNVDGFIDTAHWTVDTMLPDQPVKFTLITDLGKPINIYREPVIMNRPVEPGKPIKWRVGWAFRNRNDFTVPFEYRMRVPFSASQIRVQGQLKDMRFDSKGPYVLYETSLPSGSNTTAYLRYETRSISAPPVQTDRPDRNYVEKGGTVVKMVKIENLVDAKIRNITRTISIDYGEDLRAVDLNDEKVLDKQKVVRDQYTIRIPELEPKENEKIKVAYNIPVGNKRLIRTGKTSQGRKLRVYEVTSTSDIPVDNVWLEIDKVDCEWIDKSGGKVRVYGGNATFKGGQTIENYECGSTLVPLGTLQPGEKLRVGVSYLKSQPKTQENTLANMFGHFFLVIAIGLLGIGIIEGIIRAFKHLNIKPPWREN